MLHDKAHELARALRQAPEYKEVERRSAELSLDESALRMFLDFRRKEMELDTRLMSGEEGLEAEIEKLGKRREIVFLNSLIRNYVEAEMRLGLLFADVQRIVSLPLKEVGTIYEGLAAEEEEDD